MILTSCMKIASKNGKIYDVTVKTVTDWLKII